MAERLTHKGERNGKPLKRFQDEVRNSYPEFDTLARRSLTRYPRKFDERRISGIYDLVAEILSIPPHTLPVEDRIRGSIPFTEDTLKAIYRPFREKIKLNENLGYGLARALLYECSGVGLVCIWRFMDEQVEAVTNSARKHGSFAIRKDGKPGKKVFSCTRKDLAYSESKRELWPKPEKERELRRLVAKALLGVELELPTCSTEILQLRAIHDRVKDQAMKYGFYEQTVIL